MDTALQFSGGKDSLACLYLLEPQWPDLVVVWCNTGAAFPETLEQMERIRTLVPHFAEIRGEQSIPKYGYPADVLPVASSWYGQQFENGSGIRFQSRYDCCAAALWTPTFQAMKSMGITRIIRGEKHLDAKKSGMVTGTVIDGITYEFPLQGWSNQDVLAYLAEKDVKLPANYRSMTTSLDCWNCTAYLDENAGRLDYMRAHHPQKADLVMKVLAQLAAQIELDTQPLRDLL
jgi:phosphoadenosine phosphosulfate reductase